VGDGDGDGEGGGEGLGWAEGDGDGSVDGVLEGEAEGLPDGDALGDGEDGVGGVHEPGRNGSCESPPHPCTTPAGRAYQSRMLAGSALTKRFMIVIPTFSP